jgi:hypothetical protein
LEERENFEILCCDATLSVGVTRQVLSLLDESNKGRFCSSILGGEKREVFKLKKGQKTKVNDLMGKV